MLSVFFNSANVSASVSGLVYFMTIFVTLVVWLNQGVWPAAVMVFPVSCRELMGVVVVRGREEWGEGGEREECEKCWWW